VLEAVHLLHRSLESSLVGPTEGAQQNPEDALSPLAPYILSVHMDGTWSHRCTSYGNNLTFDMSCLSHVNAAFLLEPQGVRRVYYFVLEKLSAISIRLPLSPAPSQTFFKTKEKQRAKIFIAKRKRKD
jgi:hypothetical protein